jgi:ABC-type Fe3+-hydroxamate transport system substrate-binding protein
MRRVLSKLLGKEIPIPEPLTRIVNINHEDTETLFILELGDSIVAKPRISVIPISTAI